MIDPMERIVNPWQRMDFCVRLHFSRRTYKRWGKGEIRDNPALQITHYPQYDLPSLFHFAQK